MTTDELQNVNDEDLNDFETEDTGYEELETSDDYVEVDDEGESHDDEPADSEPDSETEHEVKGGLTPKAQDKVNERIGKITRERAEAERRANELEKQLEATQQQLVQTSEPVVPDLPDPDTVSPQEFDQAVQAREAALRQHHDWRTKSEQVAQQAQLKQQQQMVKNQQRVVKSAQTYNTRAKNLNVSEQELAQAAGIVQQVGLSEDLAMHILEDEQGPLITKHLGNNVDDLLEVAGMNPLQAALHIERKIKPKLKPAGKRTKAKRPPKRVNGGAPRRKDRFPLTGGKATFE